MLGAVVAAGCAVHPGHSIAEVASLCKHTCTMTFWDPIQASEVRILRTPTHSMRFQQAKWRSGQSTKGKDLQKKHAYRGLPAG